MEEEVEFYDAEDQINFKQDISFKLCILNHLAKISTICTKELMEGYWEKKPIHIGGAVEFVKKYHEDTREAYCNSVNYLCIMLFPHFDDKIDVKPEFDYKKTVEERLLTANNNFLELSKLLKRLNYFESGVLRQ